MSKNTSSEIKLTPTAPAALPALKGLNLQVFVMIAAIVVIMLFFTWVTDGAYLSARNISNLLRQTAITGILAVGMVFVIISAEIDLSVGSMMGLLGGAAAIFDVWLGAGSPSAGNIAELDAIAACVIGGTSLAGGIGSVAGAVMGAFIMSALDNGMSMMDVATFWQYIVKGAILLLAVWMDSATKRRA
ncbi:hypothetical protein FD793_25900 [Klebsiella pneumoniae]|uniref:hypothetical protein n=1 Tax=Klebsiella pneumoniae TaxID=573 RepID=UPI0014628AD9|nr:hypothetical protein [Klebsiella pneumoniae]MBQ5025381.1 hypothetical protein [Klebsiella pneumoniae]QJJ73197.1 hypothetical protein HJX50_00925 [Klebsiella pneumoniae]HBU1163337.1 hypothetical protein [Klebsiella pneumoniae]HBU1235994.1 hypothetical protein [Klebsiella pneumoniae]HBU1535762.1 hypothetical protein [Klebsiella pneumoniae]